MLCCKLAAVLVAACDAPNALHGTRTALPSALAHSGGRLARHRAHQRHGGPRRRPLPPDASRRDGGGRPGPADSAHSGGASGGGALNLPRHVPPLPRLDQRVLRPRERRRSGPVQPGPVQPLLGRHPLLAQRLARRRRRARRRAGRRRRRHGGGPRGQGCSAPDSGRRLASAASAPARGVHGERRALVAALLHRHRDGACRPLIAPLQSSAPPSPAARKLPRPASSATSPTASRPPRCSLPPCGAAGTTASTPPSHPPSPLGPPSGQAAAWPVRPHRADGSPSTSPPPSPRPAERA